MSSRCIAVVGATVWPGSGPDVLVDHTVVATDGKVTAVGPRDQVVVPAEARVIDASGLTVLPGLTDAHVHLTTNSDESRVVDNAAYLSNTRYADMTLHGIRNATRALRSGFTTLRVMGLRHAGEVSYRDFIDQGLMPGPRLFVAPWWVSMTNGHGDLFYYVNRRPREQWDTADGPDACRQMVRLQAREGADFIKVMASGGTMSTGDAPHWPNYTVAELASIVDEAHSMDLRVAAHAHSAEGVRRSIAAGVDSIEHGSFIGEEEIAMLVDTGTFLVPTLSIGDWLATNGENRGAGAENLDKLKRLKETHSAATQAAFEAGVKIAMGTDSSGDFCPFGEHARELELYVELGMKPHQALETATAAAAELLGKAGEIGVIAEGSNADFVMVQGDPLADITVLRQCGAIRHVVKAGVDYSALLDDAPETEALRVPPMPRVV